MTHNWHSSKRPKDPPGWRETREYVIARAGARCQSPGCTEWGVDVDHIVNLASGGTHDVDNLWLLCSWHHKRKTAQEAAAARGPALREKRPSTPHPGLLPPSTSPTETA